MLDRLFYLPLLAAVCLSSCSAQPTPVCNAVEQLMATNEFYGAFIKGRIDSTGFVLSDDQEQLGPCTAGTTHGVPFSVTKNSTEKSVRHISFKFGQKSAEEFTILFISAASNQSLHGVFTIVEGKPVIRKVYEGDF